MFESNFEKKFNTDALGSRKCRLTRALLWVLNRPICG